MSVFNLFGNQFAFIGERDPIYTDMIIEGDITKFKFIIYLYNLEKQKNSKSKNYENQCVGILVWGLPKVHLMLREAMRLETLPKISKFKDRMGRTKISYRDIWNGVIQHYKYKQDTKRDLYLE